LKKIKNAEEYKKANVATHAILKSRSPETSISIPKYQLYVSLHLPPQGKMRKVDEVYLEEVLPILITEEWPSLAKDQGLQEVCSRMVKKIYSDRYRTREQPDWKLKWTPQ
jgi:hypothetical protein